MEPATLDSLNEEHFEMRIGVPTDQNQGLQSHVADHFGSSGCLLIHDTDSGQTESLDNVSVPHEHGACNPVAMLGGRQVDAVLVGGIGRGAIEKFQASGIRVFRAIPGTLERNLNALQGEGLIELDARQGCAGHGHDHDHGHSHGHHCSH